MSAPPLSPDGPYGWFADHVLRNELPDLPDERRATTVAFVCRRANDVPTPLRVGVTVLAVLTGRAAQRFGMDRTAAFVSSTPVPFVGELTRMVRSLGVAFVWETWPSSSPTGAPDAVAEPA